MEKGSCKIMRKKHKNYQGYQIGFLDNTTEKPLHAQVSKNGIIYNQKCKVLSFKNFSKENLNMYDFYYDYEKKVVIIADFGLKGGGLGTCLSCLFNAKNMKTTPENGDSPTKNYSTNNSMRGNSDQSNDQQTRMQKDIDLNDPVIEKLLMTRIDNNKIELKKKESIDLICALAGKGKERAEKAKNQEIVIQLGNTGAGKSTQINYFLGQKFKYEPWQKHKKEGVFEDIMTVKGEEIMKIGHENVSMTILSKGVKDKQTGQQIFDCAGFNDSRGFEINISNNVNLKAIINNAFSMRALLVCSFDSLKADRGTGFKEMLKTADTIFGGPDKLVKHKNCFYIIVTKVPKGYSLENIRQRIAHRADVHVLSLIDRIFTFDPADRHIDGGWTYREFKQRVVDLKPLHNLSVHPDIQIALIDSDKTALNDLASYFEEEIKDWLKDKSGKDSSAEKILNNFINAAKDYDYLNKLKIIGEDRDVTRYIELSKDIIIKQFVEEKIIILEMCTKQQFTKAIELTDSLVKAGEVFDRSIKNQLKLENLKNEIDAVEELLEDQKIEDLNKLRADAIRDPTQFLQNIGLNRMDKNMADKWVGEIQDMVAKKQTEIQIRKTLISASHKEFDSPKNAGIIRSLTSGKQIANKFGSIQELDPVNDYQDPTPAEPIEKYDEVIREMGDMNGNIGGNLKMGTNTSNVTMNKNDETQGGGNNSGGGGNNSRGPNVINNVSKNITAGDITGNIGGNVQYGDNNYNINFYGGGPPGAFNAGPKNPTNAAQENTALTESQKQNKQGLDEATLKDIENQLQKVLADNIKECEQLMPEIIDNVFTKEQLESSNLQEQAENQKTIDSLMTAVKKKVYDEQMQLQRKFWEDPTANKGLLDITSKAENERKKERRRSLVTELVDKTVVKDLVKNNNMDKLIKMIGTNESNAKDLIKKLDKQKTENVQDESERVKKEMEDIQTSLFEYDKKVTQQQTIKKKTLIDSIDFNLEEENSEHSEKKGDLAPITSDRKSVSKGSIVYSLDNSIFQTIASEQMDVIPSKSNVTEKNLSENSDSDFPENNIIDDNFDIGTPENILKPIQADGSEVMHNYRKDLIEIDEAEANLNTKSQDIDMKLEETIQEADLRQRLLDDEEAELKIKQEAEEKKVQEQQEKLEEEQQERERLVTEEEELRIKREVGIKKGEEFRRKQLEEIKKKQEEEEAELEETLKLEEEAEILISQEQLDNEEQVRIEIERKLAIEKAELEKEQEAQRQEELREALRLIKHSGMTLLRDIEDKKQREKQSELIRRKELEDQKLRLKIEEEEKIQEKKLAINKKLELVAKNMISKESLHEQDLYREKEERLAVLQKEEEKQNQQREEQENKRQQEQNEIAKLAEDVVKKEEERKNTIELTFDKEGLATLSMEYIPATKNSTRMQSIEERIAKGKQKSLEVYEKNRSVFLKSVYLTIQNILENAKKNTEIKHLRNALFGKYLKTREQLEMEKKIQNNSKERLDAEKKTNLMKRQHIGTETNLKSEIDLMNDKLRENKIIKENFEKQQDKLAQKLENEIDKINAELKEAEANNKELLKKKEIEESKSAYEDENMQNVENTSSRLISAPKFSAEEIKNLSFVEKNRLKNETLNQSKILNHKKNDKVPYNPRAQAERLKQEKLRKQEEKEEEERKRLQYELEEKKYMENILQKQQKIEDIKRKIQETNEIKHKQSIEFTQKINETKKDIDLGQVKLDFMIKKHEKDRKNLQYYEAEAEEKRQAQLKVDGKE